MGAYRVVLVGVGGHGCDRKAKPGEALTACGQPSCPDCIAREFAQRLGIRSHEQAYSIPLAPGADITPEQIEAGGTVVVHSESGDRYVSMPKLATLTHWPGQAGSVVDDLVSDVRVSGSF